MKKFEINLVIVVLGIVSIVELIVSKGMFGSMWLWIGYGIYRVWLK
jgi:hypothetical protein